jgi:PAS domain S-box-containing protein
MMVSENVNERRYRLLSEVVAAIVWSASGSGEVDSELPSWSAFTGQTCEELQRWGWLSAIHPDDQTHTASDCSRPLRPSQSSVRRVGYAVKMANTGICLRVARPSWIRLGAVIEWVGVYVDITDVPIVALTAHAMQGDRERFLAAVMDGYLSKPIPTKKLYTLLKGWAQSPRNESIKPVRADPDANGKARFNFTSDSGVVSSPWTVTTDVVNGRPPRYGDERSSRVRPTSCAGPTACAETQQHVSPNER